MNADAIAESPRIAENRPDSSVHPHWAAASTPLTRSEPLPDRSALEGPCPYADVAGFVVLSQFAIACMTEEVKQAFQQRPHRVDNAAGFVRMEVLSPCDAPNEIWLITYWKDESSYRCWHHSHLYKESHQGIPRGLRLVPKSVSIRFLEHVAS
jgi:heme-degrading monooxygenase HmoA